MGAWATCDTMRMKSCFQALSTQCKSSGGLGAKGFMLGKDGCGGISQAYKQQIPSTDL